MKKYICIPLLLISFTFPSHIWAAELIDGIAAIVNEDIITTRQLDHQIAIVHKQLTTQKITIPAHDVFTNQVLQMMIDQLLEQQTAKKLNIQVTDQDIRNMVQAIAKQQNMNPQQFQASLAQHGISESAFIQQIKTQILNDKLLRALVAPKITVSDDEINAGTKIALSQAGQQKEYHLLHIAIPLPAAPTPDQIAAAKEKAGRIVAELQTGASFETVAAAESNGTDALNGGDIGWKNLEELPPDYADAISSAKVGDVIGPLDSPAGFEILKVEDIRGKSVTLNKSTVRQQVADMIFQRKVQEQQQIWLQQLRAGAYIKILYNGNVLPTPLN